MQIKVRYLGLVRSKIGKNEEDLDFLKNATLLDLLNKLVEIYGEQLKYLFDVEKESTIDPTFIVTINGTLSDQLQGLNTKLNNGDEITLMTLISGG